MKMSQRCISRIITVICVATLMIGAIPMSALAATDLGNGWFGTSGSIQNIVSVNVEGSEHTVTIIDGDRTTQTVAANNGVLAPVEKGHYVFAFKVDSSTTSPEITIALSEGVGASGESIGKNGNWWSGWFLSLDGMDDGEGTASFYTAYNSTKTKIGSDVAIKADEYNFVYAELRGAGGATQLLRLYLNGTYIGYFEIWGAEGSGEWGRAPYDDGTALEMAVGSVANAHAEITIDMDPIITASEVTTLVNMCDAHTNPNAQVSQETIFRATVDSVREQLNATKDYYGWWALANTLNVAKAQYDAVDFEYNYGNGWGEYLGTVNTTTFETDDTNKSATHIALTNSGTAIRRTIAPGAIGHYAYAFSVSSANTTADELIIQFATSDHSSAAPGAMATGWYLNVTGMNGDSPTMSVIEREGGVTVDRTTKGQVFEFEKDTEYYIDFQINSNNWIDIYANGEMIGSCCTWSSGHPNSSVSAYTSADAYGVIGVMATGGALSMSFDHDPFVSQEDLQTFMDKCDDTNNFMASATQETAYRNAVTSVKTMVANNQSAYACYQSLQVLETAWQAYTSNDGGVHTFYMEDGASVRTAADTSGLRFTTYIDTDLYAFLVAEKAAGRITSYKFQTLLIPRELLQGTLTVDTPDVLNIEHTLYHNSSVPGTKRITAVLWDIPPEDYGTMIAARSYLNVVFADGSSQNIYTPFTTENHVRNVSVVANRARNDESISYDTEEVKILERYDLTHVAHYVHNVADFTGADDDELFSNALAALQEDIDFTKRAGKTATYELGFENREYRFAKTLNFSNIDGLTVNGNGAQFIFTNFVNALAVDNCEEMTLNDFSVDYYPLPFTQGVIASISGTTITVTMDSGYSPKPSLFGTDVIYGNIHDRTTGAVKENTASTLTFNTPTAGDKVWQLKVTAASDISNFTVGDILTLFTRKEAAMLFTNYKNVTLNDVNLYSSPGAGISSRGGYGNMKLNNVNIVPGEAPNGFDVARLRSTNSDGTHFAEHTVGPTLDNCTITHCGDDCINVQSFYYHILEVIDSNTIIACPKNDRDVPLVGETLEFCEKTSYDYLATAKIASIEKRYDSSYEDEKAVAWANSYHWQNEGYCIYEITLDRDVNLKQYDHFTSMDRLNNGTVIKNSTFGWNRARGIVVKCPDALIENNHIERCTNDGLMALPDLAWAESHFVSNLVVRGNTFVRNNHCKNALVAPNTDSIGSIVIGVVPLTNVSGLMNNYGNVNITIEDNEIIDSRTYGIVVTNANGVTVKNNKVTNPFHAGTGNTSWVYGTKPNAGIFIGMAKNVTVTGNTVSKTNSAVTQAVQTSSVSGTVTNSNNTLK